MSDKVVYEWKDKGKWKYKIEFNSENDLYTCYYLVPGSDVWRMEKNSFSSNRHIAHLAERMKELEKKYQELKEYDHFFTMQRHDLLKYLNKILEENRKLKKEKKDD